MLYKDTKCKLRTKTRLRSCVVDMTQGKHQDNIDKSPQCSSLAYLKLPILKRYLLFSKQYA